MKVLVVGGGGREHALAWAFSRSPLAPELHAAPGNAGIASVAACHAVGAEDIEGIADLARSLDADLVVVGPEAPLCAGIADRLAADGIPTFGPNRDAARIEGSKIYAKDVMTAAGAPTGDAEICASLAEAEAAIRRRGAPVVVKADGLAAGKGVTVARTAEAALAAARRMMADREFGAAGSRILVEECLDGQEASILALVDGECFVTLAASQDHKRLLDGDEGPNTGGMGAYSPTPFVDASTMDRVEREILAPVVRELAARGTRYRGVLYAGIMLTSDGPRVLEFNCRFGDPETQAVMPRMKTDPLEAVLATVEGRLERFQPQWLDESALCVVLASGGYPGDYRRGIVIDGLSEASAMPGVVVYHAGTKQGESGTVVSNGGRVLGVTALGSCLRDAADRAYAAVDRIRFERCVFRKDIGAKAFAAEK